MSAIQDRTSLSELLSSQLAMIGHGPLRCEHKVSSPPNTVEARLAIRILGERAAAGDKDSLDGLMDVIQFTNWYDTIELALELFMVAAPADQLARLGRHLCACFCDSGEGGGGVASLRRLKGVQTKLTSLGLSLIDLVPASERAQMESTLRLADRFASEAQGKGG